MTGKWRTGSGKKGQDGANEKEQDIGKDQDTNHILDYLPLEKRLNLMTLIIIIFLAVLVTYLIVTVTKSRNAYTQSIANIIQTNSVTANLQEDADYSMYRIVIGMQTYQSIHEPMEEDRSYGWEQIKDPHQTISDTRKTYCQLLRRTPEGANWIRVNWLLHRLDQLEQRVDEIEDNLPHNMYDKNMEILDYGVRVLIADIERQGREYVYYETPHVQEIQKELESQEHTAIVVSLTLLVSILIISPLLSRKITKSITVLIQELCNEMEKVAKGDFTSGPRIETGDELAILMGSFDHMKEEIGRLIEDIRQEQNQRRVMELQLLQEQISSHFLHNTLDIIAWLAEGGQNRAVVDMVTSLSEFFRTTLSGGKDFITMWGEVGHIKSYLQTQKIRYQDIMDYEVTLEKFLEERRVLKLTLQPLVENTLYYGIENKRGRGRVRVREYVKEDTAVLGAEDDGAGMTEEEMEVIRRKLRGEKDLAFQEGSAPRGGFGLFSVTERLRLNYGSRCSLESESVLGLGAKAVVNILLESGYDREGED